MADTRIKHTHNYRLFERSADNRETNAGKRRQLQESLKQYGWLPSMPAVCKLLPSGKLRVLDGQHRIAIAAAMGIEVHYVHESCDFDVAVTNSGARPWVIGDYAHRYATQGKADYREVVTFHEENHVPIGMAAALLAGTISFGNIDTDFKNGTFRIKDREWAKAVASIYVPLVQMSPCIRNARFLEACMCVCRVPNFEMDRLLSGAKHCREKLVAYSTRDAYLDMMENLYNYKRQKLVPLKINAANAMKARCATTQQKQKKMSKNSKQDAS